MKLMLPGNKELESNYMTHIVSVHISNTQPEFYVPILCSYLQKIKKKLYSVNSNFDKVCHIKHDHLVHFYISLEKHEKLRPHADAQWVSLLYRWYAILDF